MSLDITLSDALNTLRLEVTEYSVRESGSPLAAGDSSGSTGTITFSVPAPDPIASNPLTYYGPWWMIGKNVELADSRRGYTVGKVVDVSEQQGGWMLDVTCDTRMGELNIYNVQAQPFSGTLRDAYIYYLGLAGVTTGIFVENSLAFRHVDYPGWNGELWYHLKMLATAQDAELTLVSGLIMMRPTRSRFADLGHATEISRSTGNQSLAQAIEVYQYNSRPIVGGMVWPVDDYNGGDTFNVAAGDITEYALEFSASLTSLEQPTPQDWVSPYESNASVYSILTSGGDRISADEWTLHGGKVEVILNPDTMTARLIITGPEGIVITTPGAPGENGEPDDEPTSQFIDSFILADYSDGEKSRRGTLRLMGTGVAYSREKKRIPTGVPASRATTEIGVTIDNPFINTSAELYRAGGRAAIDYSGMAPAITASVTAVNRLGETGDVTMPSYADVEASMKGAFGNAVSYAQVESFFANAGLTTYKAIEDQLYSTVRSNFENQAFGNVAGARLYDGKSRQWYRVREGTLTPESISVQGEYDTLHSDWLASYGNLTYGTLEGDKFFGLTYQQVQWMGVTNG